MCRILIVDDVEGRFDQWTRLAHRASDRFEFDFASDKTQAENLIKEAAQIDCPFEIVLSDTCLGVSKQANATEGLLVLAEAKRQNPDCFTILIIWKSDWMVSRLSVDRFVSPYYTNRDYETQIVEALRDAVGLMGYNNF